MSATPVQLNPTSGEPSPALRASWPLLVLGLCVVMLSAGALIPFAASHSGGLTYMFGAVAAVAILVALFNIPVRLLPSVTLLATLLLPTETTLLPHVLVGSAPGIVPLAVWMIRARSSNRVPSALRILALALGAWLVLSQVFAPLHTHHSWEWLVAGELAFVLSIIATPSGLKPRDFRALFLTVTTVLGAYALIEGLLLHNNLLFAPLYDHTTWWLGQHKIASYRVSTLLGHPLFNGTVFSAAAVLAASDLLEKRRNARFAFARLAILIGAVLTTHSRGAAIALAAGIFVVILFSRGEWRGQGTRRLVLILSSILGVAFIVVALQARNDSSAGQASAATRVAVLTRASETIPRVEPFGAGPGESDTYRTLNQLPGAGPETALENSYAELAVSLGPIGVLLLSILLLAVVIVGIRSGTVTGEAAALFAILVDMASFNAIEGHRPLLILIALFVISIVTGAGASAARAESPPAL